MCADISPGQHNLQSVKRLAQQVGAFKETAHEASNRGMPACRFADRLLCPAVPSCRDLPPGALNMTEQLIGRPPSCRCTPQELQDVIQQALQKLTAG